MRCIVWRSSRERQGAKRPELSDSRRPRRLCLDADDRVRRGATTSTVRRSDRRCDGRADPATVIGVGLHLSQIDEADELLTKDPLALLIGMVLDQHIGQTRNKM